ncbi:MAG TPA: GAF domain-containing protein [Rhodothermales bacterium]|nr:GAF domain-containing protein [Rhodothermales bacterium]
MGIVGGTVHETAEAGTLPASREDRYEAVLGRIRGLLEGEDDWIAAMATVACELHQAFESFHWTGFYRVTGPSLLVVGPYQGGHGCLRIPFDRGVCGAAARTRTTQLVPDVSQFPGHIACASSTRSEIVVPVVTSDGRLLAVLDVDSNFPGAFNGTDKLYLERLCAELGRQFQSATFA